jgi:hypothetical protein
VVYIGELLPDLKTPQGKHKCKTHDRTGYALHPTCGRKKIIGVIYVNICISPGGVHTEPASLEGGLSLSSYVSADLNCHSEHVL